MITRDQYGTGISVHAVEHADQVIIVHGAQIRTVDVKTGKDVLPKKGKVVTSPDTFATWKVPLFEEVVAHSLFSNERREHSGGRSKSLRSILKEIRFSNQLLMLNE